MLFVSLLPGSIRILNLACFGQDVEVMSPPLLRLASAAPEYFRRLESVYVLLDCGVVPGYDDEEATRVMAAFKQLGVKIQIDNFVDA